MKSKIVFSTGLFVVSVFMFLSLTALDNPQDKFLIVAMHSGVDTSPVNYTRLKDSLGLNGWHRYNQWFTGDEINGNISFISPRVQYRVDQNNTRDLRTVFGRRITDYSAWGQRSDYQCENVTEGQPYWFYSYYKSVSNSWIHDIPDSGQTVKFCKVDTSNPGRDSGYIVQGLKANREQANRFWTPYQSDTFSDWYVKPKIRIPTGLSINTKVCRIEILDWDSSIVKSIELTVNEFKDGNQNYNGNYMEEFYFQPNVLSPIKIDSPGLCPGPDSLRKYFWDWGSTTPLNTIKTDFRVFWYGQCDVWIDRIRVENEQARLLFENTDTKARIVSEVNSALLEYDASRPNDFYLEEFEFNTTPCINRVREIIDSVSQGRLTLITNLNPYMYNFAVPNYKSNRFTAEDFKKYLVEDGGVSKIATTFYFLEGFEQSTNRESYNPNTLPVYSVFPSINYNPAKGILAYKETPANYDNWLQTNFDENTELAFDFSELLKLMDTMAKDKGIEFYSLHQSYSWFLPLFKLKEPTNEESEMTANLAISYGAKGLMYFAFNGNVTDNGFNSDYGHNGVDFFQAGFLDSNLSVRINNAYGQNRWDYYKKYNSKLDKWGPYLMSFDNANRKSYIYRIPSERTEMTNSTLISELKTYPHVEFDPDPYPDIDNLPADTGSNVYLQAGFFNKPDDTGINKYFMIVNRRCSPFVNDSSPSNVGGRRFVSMKINPSHLPGFNNWKIYDLETGDTVRTLSKTSTAYIYLGDFMPGEGRLYKLAPVMQEGGTLVADESIDNINFNCNGDVNNNGKNITLYVVETS